MKLDKTEIKYSPVARTAQTSKIIFGSLGAPQLWLRKGCTDNFLAKVNKARMAGRNLALVTHSSCINSFNSELNIESSDVNFGLDENFGVTEFFTYAENIGEPKFLGCIWPEQWSSLGNSEYQDVEYE